MFQFIPHIIDSDLPEGYYAQTVLVDLNNDGRLEYVLGQQYGSLFWYQYHAPDRWTRHLFGEHSPSDVGACALDVDGDGWIDIVTGGAWYRNSRHPETPFERIPFDPALAGAHDLLAADIDGDGRPEVLSMSDQNDLRWYKIPADPTRPWTPHSIGPAMHAGLSVGDLDGDGCLDVVRTDVWFENVEGDGTRWEAHPTGPNTPPPPDFRPPFAFNATISLVRDMDRDGKNDIVFTDAEFPGGKIWWMENLDGDGDFDLFSCEMEAVPGERPPRYYIGGHAAVVGDLTGNGQPDILAKP